MLFSEKMKAVPQPDRAALWDRYRILCRALMLRVQLSRENRDAVPEELQPLKKAAAEANRILTEHGMSPSFEPDSTSFLSDLWKELDQIMLHPSPED